MQNGQTSKIKARFFFKFKLAMSGKEICIYFTVWQQKKELFTQVIFYS